MNLTDIRERKSASIQIVSSEFSSDSKLMQPLYFLCNFENRELLAVLDIGHQQTTRGVHRHRHVVRRHLGELCTVAVHQTVELGKLQQRQRRTLPHQ